MSLRKSPVRTPALLAANRANAKESTGARTPEGKARVALNTLKHGRRAKRVRQNLVKAGMQEGERLYRWLLERLARAFEPHGRKDWQLADRMARQAWSQFWRRRGLHQTEPECALESARNNPQHPSLLRIRIDDPRQRRGLVFWLQRHRYWTLDRWMKLVEEAPAGKPREGPLRPRGRPEHRLRARRFRPARPSLWRLQALEQKLEAEKGGFVAQDSPFKSCGFSRLLTGVEMPQVRNAGLALHPRAHTPRGTNVKIALRGDLYVRANTR